MIETKWPTIRASDKNHSSPRKSTHQKQNKTTDVSNRTDNVLIFLQEKTLQNEVKSSHVK